MVNHLLPGQEDNSISDSSAKARLLRDLCEEGVINEAAYRTQLQALGVDPDAILAPSPPPNLAALRERLSHLYGQQIDALALDHFPRVYDKFSRGLQCGEKIALLLDIATATPKLCWIWNAGPTGNWLPAPRRCAYLLPQPCHRGGRAPATVGNLPPLQGWKTSS